MAEVFVRFTVSNQGVRYKDHDGSKQMFTVLRTDRKFGEC